MEDVAKSQISSILSRPARCHPALCAWPAIQARRAKNANRDSALAREEIQQKGPMKIKHWNQFICTIVCATFLAATAATVSTAQTNSQLDRLEVDLWPELDRPEMLVIYRGTLKADVPLPATLTLQLPSQIDVPHAVAYSDEDGNLFDATYTTESTDAGLQVTLETPSRNFQLEYYDELTYDGDLRSYTFVWLSDYAVDQLDVAFLPPPGATQIQTQPALDPAQQSSGETVYLGMLGNVAQGQSTQVALSYLRSASARTVAPSIPSDEDDININVPLMAAGALVLLGLVIVGVVWYTRRSKRQPTKAESQAQRPKRSKKRSKTAGNKQAPPTVGHCTQCGRSVGVDDRFCGQCGAPVKGKT